MSTLGQSIHYDLDGVMAPKSSGQMGYKIHRDAFLSSSSWQMGYKIHVSELL